MRDRRMKRLAGKRAVEESTVRQAEKAKYAKELRMKLETVDQALAENQSNTREVRQLTPGCI